MHLYDNILYTYAYTSEIFTGRAEGASVVDKAAAKSVHAHIHTHM